MSNLTKNKCVCAIPGITSECHCHTKISSYDAEPDGSLDIPIYNTALCNGQYAVSEYEFKSIISKENSREKFIVCETSGYTIESDAFYYVVYPDEDNPDIAYIHFKLSTDDVLLARGTYHLRSYMKLPSDKQWKEIDITTITVKTNPIMGIDINNQYITSNPDTLTAPFTPKLMIYKDDTSEDTNYYITDVPADTVQPIIVNADDSTQITFNYSSYDYHKLTLDVYIYTDAGLTNKVGILSIQTSSDGKIVTPENITLQWNTVLSYGDIEDINDNLDIAIENSDNIDYLVLTLTVSKAVTCKACYTIQDI